MTALDDLPGGSDDRLGDCAVEQTQPMVHLRRGLLDHRHRMDETRRQPESADRKVVDRTLGLGAIQGVGRYRNLAHAVVFDAMLCRHGSSYRAAGVAEITPRRPLRLSGNTYPGPAMPRNTLCMVEGVNR